MKVNYTEVYPFRPIPTITPASSYWENGTWKFNMPEITPDTAYTPSFIDVILHGTTALSLVNSKADGLNYLKLFGGTEQRNLPEGYTELDSITMPSGTCAIGLTQPTANGRVELDFTTTTLDSTTRNFYGGRYDNGPVGAGIRLTHNSSKDIIAYGFDTNSTGSGNYRFQNNTRYKYIYDNGTLTIITGGSTVYTQNFTINDTNTSDVIINGYRQQTGAIVPNSEVIAYNSYKVYNAQGVLVENWIPALKGTTVCYYDTVSGTDILPLEGTFTAGAVTVPTPDTPIDIISNNGVIKFGKQLTLDSSRYYAYIYTDDTWKYSNDSYSIVIPVTVGHKYKITVPTTNPLNNAQNVIFRYGFVDTINEDWKNDNLTGQTPIPIYDYVRTTPQDLPSVEVTATHPYLVIQMGQAAFSYILTNNLITVIDQTTYIDGTTETVEVIGKNLFDEDSTFSIGQYSDGVWAVQNNRLTTDYIAISPQTNYTVSVDMDYTYNLGLVNYNYFSADKTWLGNRATNGDTSFGDQKTKTFNISNTNARYVKITIRKADNSDISTITPAQAKIQLELGSTATTYEPYYNGGSATAEMLLAVGSYQDIQSVLDGEVTRKVGIKVLDGTEDIGKSGAYAGSFFIRNVVSSWGTTNRAPVFCTHFSNVTAESDYNAQGECIILNNAFNMWWGSDSTPTAAQFSAWLAEQYANGTPVIVLYQKSTATTETVTPQPLTIQAGTNIVEITQASMDNLELEVSYKAGIEVTITEIENAQLDNSVEVTIQ